MGTPVIEVAGLSKSFGKRGEQEVIQRLDLTVDRGEFVTVVGASGCGKSTLLNIIAGLDKPTQGNVVVTGKVALMFQDATLLPWLSAIQNIQLALRLQGVQEPARTTRAQELLNIVRLGDAMHKRPHELFSHPANHNEVASQEPNPDPSRRVETRAWEALRGG